MRVSKLESFLNNHSVDPGRAAYITSNQWYCIDDTKIKTNPRTGKKIFDENGKVKHVDFTIDITKAFSGMSIETELTVKLFLLNKHRFVDGQLFIKKSTLESKIAVLSYIAEACKENGFSSYSKINRNNRDVFCVALVKRNLGINKIGPKNIDPNFRAYGAFQDTLSLLYQIKLDQLVHQFPDAPSCELNINDGLDAVKPIVSERLDWKEWCAGGTLGTFPLELSLLLLQEGITFLESDEIPLLTSIIHATHEFSIKYKLKGAEQVKGHLNNALSADFGYDEEGPFKVGLAKGKREKREVIKRRPSAYKKLPLAWELYALICKKYLELGLDPKSMVLPTSSGDVTNRIRIVIQRCSAMVTILSAARISELASMRKDSFEVVRDSHATFKSRIKKTNNEIETVRPITLHAANFAWILINLSRPGSIQTDGDDQRLFKVSVPWVHRSLDGLNYAKNGHGVTALLYKILEGLVSDFDRTEYPISSHRFRHTWVELAIRRFDGAVTEAVRNHLRHWHGSGFTTDYIKDKVKADIPEIARGYMKELIHRAATGREEFFGPSGRYLLKRIREIEALTPELINDLLNEFDVLEVHEYSYCMIPKHHKTQSKCFDKATQSPQYANAKWENCGGCVGRFTLSNQRDVIERIGMREQEVMNDRANRKLTVLASHSKKVIKQCEAALSDLDKHIPLVQVPILSDE